MDALILTLTGVIPSIITSVITFLFTRRKNNADANKIEEEAHGDSIQNIMQAWEGQKKIYDNTIQKQNELIESYEKRINNLEEVVMKLSTGICTDLSCQLRKLDFKNLQFKED